MSAPVWDTYPQSQIHPVFQQVASQWVAQIERAKRHKAEVFSRYAQECMSYYCGPKSWDELMGRDDTVPSGIEFPTPGFKMHVNKAYEYVKIFGPSLYYTNPVRTIKPRAPVQVPAEFFPDQNQFLMMAQADQMRVAIDGIRAILLEGYLNWTPSRYGLDHESRLAIDEALIKGRGLLWTELSQSPDGAFCAVVSRWDSVDRLLIDPDADSVPRAKWVARQCIQPTWEVERDYGLKKGSLKGNFESMMAQADLSMDPYLRHKRALGQTADLIVFYQVWSKMGMGGRLLGANPKTRDALDDIFGDHCYVVVASNCRFPLNLPPDLVNGTGQFEDTIRAASWPIPYWRNGSWPFEELDFNSMFDSPWPFAPLLAARGELRFMNWVFSFLAGHLHNACRDFIAVAKSLPEEVKTAILGGKDLTLLELEHDHGVISDVVQFLQHPQVNGDIWLYLNAVSEAFDKRMGMTAGLYGDEPESQPRSAAESNIRNEVAGIRPEDMGNQVEGWQTKVATKEAFCARYFLQGSDVQICLGPLAAQAWNQFVFTEDAEEAFHALEYRIEAGSTRRPNKEFAVRQMTEAVQVLTPVFQAYATQTGDMQPLNNLVTDFCKSRDLDPNRYQMLAALLAPMLPSPAPANPTSQGNVSVPPASGQPSLG